MCVCVCVCGVCVCVCVRLQVWSGKEPKQNAAYCGGFRDRAPVPSTIVLHEKVFSLKHVKYFPAEVGLCLK